MLRVNIHTRSQRVNLDIGGSCFDLLIPDTGLHPNYTHYADRFMPGRGRLNYSNLGDRR